MLTCGIHSKTGDKMLKEYMYENNITQRELAKKLGCSAPHINLILSGKKKVSDRLQYKIDKLLPSHGTQNTEPKNNEN